NPKGCICGSGLKIDRRMIPLTGRTGSPRLLSLARLREICYHESSYIHSRRYLEFWEGFL
ncbi:hypothetical protein, partial [Candidatus Hakubella thermalkaliphila]|uniref:hypothetical protein n=1 Tax=Candidatus Hakubella thermalkaliphila TaxID=2754717 RepID=UPI001C615240